MKNVSIQQADIKTASIDVKVMSVNNRNLTLSVFRQIQSREPLIDFDTLTLNGEIWGRINYYWGDDVNKTSSPVWAHVLWVNHNREIRRTIFFKNLIITPEQYHLLMVTGRTNECEADDWDDYYDLLKEMNMKFRESLKEHLLSIRKEIYPIKFKGAMFDSVNRWISNQRGLEDYLSDMIQTDPVEVVNKLPLGFISDDFFYRDQELTSLWNQAKQLYNSYAPLVDSIFKSEQLFIAV